MTILNLIVFCVGTLLRGGELTEKQRTLDGTP